MVGKQCSSLVKGQTDFFYAGNHSKRNAKTSVADPGESGHGPPFGLSINSGPLQRRKMRRGDLLVVFGAFGAEDRWFE